MSANWETFCDESYYHMWRIRRKNERGFNAGFHVQNGDDARAIVDLLNTLERQRDILASALDEIRALPTCQGCDPDLLTAVVIATESLHAMKGGRP